MNDPLEVASPSSREPLRGGRLIGARQEGGSANPPTADPAAHRHRWVARLGLAGSVLGVIAGAVQAAVGSRIPEWTGAKASPIALGLLTVALSAVAGWAAWRQRGPRLSVAGRAACALALAGPGLLCLSTAGRLWYPSALLMVIAGTMTIDSWPDTAKMLAVNWFRILLGALGGCQLLMAAGAPPALALVGFVGGVSLIAAAGWRSASRSVIAGLMVVGILPFAILGWAGIGPPLVAVTAALIAVPALRDTAERPAAGGGTR
ncbi:hypothetical protein [Nakamurella sp.]|uniref:hypothetical protein n=1 Tax=Nakamurella sp. TaxID=1869182 RepID=UPI003783CA25